MRRAPVAAPAPWHARFSPAVFLRRYWQQRPLLIRQAWPQWRNLVAPAALTGLAGQAEVEARLVMQVRQQWQLEHGPFPTTRWARLPRRRWTLLVQAVDHHLPQVAALFDAFSFLPAWRIDDVMISYAVDGGSVGPHFDQYDVFLLQGLGRRRWHIGQRCDQLTALAAHDELRLLDSFAPRQEWLLEPGDMLYLPPRIAHHGIAVGNDCMTYSIGMHAPSRAELISHWCDHVIAELSDDDRYVDGEMNPRAVAGVINQNELAAAHALVSARLLDRSAFDNWFGRFVTERKYAEPDPAPARAASAVQLKRRLHSGARLCRDRASRYALVRGTPVSQLFVDGRSFSVRGAAARLAEQLCASRQYQVDASAVRAQSALALATQLYAHGSLRMCNDH